MNGNKQTVLVTGGAGYIGSHACKTLANNGFFPVVYDNLSNGHEWAVKWGVLQVGDVRDTKKLKSVIKKYKPIAVMHFAASIEVAESVANPELFYENNVGGIDSLLKAMFETGVNNLVFSSSCAVYGVPKELPISETSPVAPTNPYGENKAEAEQMIRENHKSRGLNAICLRYFNAAGADPDGDLGEAHEPESHLIPILLNKVALKDFVAKVYGNDYDTPDGTCLRDFVHVSDLADAHILAMKKLLNNEGYYSEYNLGNGRPYSVKEVIECVKSVTNHDFDYQILDRRSGDVPALMADSSKAIKELSWQPKYNSLESIIETAWDWTLNNEFD